CDLYSGHVERMNQGVPNGDRAVEIFAVVVGRVFFAIESERGGYVFHGSDRSYARLQSLGRVLERSGVYEGLEHRTRLTMSQCMIELAFAIAAAADQCSNLSCVGIEGYERHLHLRNGLSLFLPSR